MRLPRMPHLAAAAALSIVLSNQVLRAAAASAAYECPAEEGPVQCTSCVEVRERAATSAAWRSWVVTAPVTPDVQWSNPLQLGPIWAR
jgi:hypothetical protein